MQLTQFYNCLKTLALLQAIIYLFSLVAVRSMLATVAIIATASVRIVDINFTFVTSAVSKDLAVTLQKPGDMPIYYMKLGIRQISASNFQVTFINSIVFPLFLLLGAHLICVINQRKLCKIQLESKLVC